MNYFIAGILKIVILEASAALAIIDRLVGTEKDSKWSKERRNGWIAIAGLSLLAFFNFGNARGGGGMVHYWEQFHFYMGTKYLKEVNSFDLYKAALIADRETVNRVAGLQTIREIHTFEQIPVAQALSETPRIKAQFTPERWEAFKADWIEWTRMPVDWNGVLNDHGNSNSPAWAIIATPLANLLPLNHGSLVFIASLDMALLAAMLFMLYRTFGVRAASIFVVLWSCTPLLFDYLAGSFLRWDWIFALTLSACFLKQKRYALAGGFLGYAIGTKLFPLFFGVAFAVQALIETVRTKKLQRKYIRFAAGVFGTYAALALVSSVMFGPRIWVDYKDRIEVAQQEKFYGIQYSLRTVFLQVAESTPSELANGWFFPGEIKQARADVNLSDHRVSFFLVQLLFTALIFAMAARTDEVSAFTLGSLLVYVWLVVNMYYWEMLALTAVGFALRRDKLSIPGLIWLHFNFALLYFYQHTRHGYAEGYVVALFIAVGVVAIGGREAYSLYREKWRPTNAPTPREAAPLASK
ncbi:MAG: glycosyltransferase family 87 protein [Myxococcaceae bacterium]